MTKKSRQTFKYLEKKKNFSDEIKSIIHHFKGISVVKNYLRPESAPLSLSYRWHLLYNLEFSQILIHILMNKPGHQDLYDHQSLKHQ